MNSYSSSPSSDETMNSYSSSPSSDEAASPASSCLDDVVCRVDALLGNGRMSVRECLALTVGCVVRLAQPAGANLEVQVNGVPIALGEVVIIDNSTSVQVSDILPPPSAGPVR